VRIWGRKCIMRPLLVPARGRAKTKAAPPSSGSVSRAHTGCTTRPAPFWLHCDRCFFAMGLEEPQGGPQGSLTQILALGGQFFLGEATATRTRVCRGRCAACVSRGTTSCARPCGLGPVSTSAWRSQGCSASSCSARPVCHHRVRHSDSDIYGLLGCSFDW
jgi:hypothetical protein